MTVRQSIRGLLVRSSVIAAAVAAALASSLGATPVAHGAIYPFPDPDAFYAPPGNIGAFAPGDVINSRIVPAHGYPGATVWQLNYRSTNSAGAPISAVTTLILPGGGGPRPIVSYQPFVNSLGTQCAPSHSLFDGSLQEAPALNLLLARGWAVAVPDHLGPTSAYGAARMGGQITLDGIRAVKRFAPAGLGDSPVGLAGYSGGAMATGFAAALAAEYAPELPIVGVALGGVPVNPGKMALQIGNAPHPLFGLGFAVAVGLEREYPAEMNLDDALSPAGLALRSQIANACVNEIISAGANHSIGEMFRPGMEASANNIRILHENSLEIYPGVPRAPVYQWHGGNDQVPLDLALSVAGRYCHAGTPVLFDVIPGADHGTAIFSGAPRAFNYLSDRFAGLAAPSNC
ncbi:Secretory lipase [Nocardia otitidiscaviarum]|uniref:Secretory lipase n=1 Tax=Nocardia otitidiscaviarum TaxID=1823 RepID=A0A379JH27_9NOCA|nr:lipase family protein [Nocardia otitidiscaviarum]SUD47852.1 Secretory lipase [Nocardia otitidiscaviarum]